MYYAEYWLDGGQLQRESEEELVAEDGRAVVAFSITPEERRALTWNPDTHAFDAPVPVPPAPKRTISKVEFLRRAKPVLRQINALTTTDENMAVFKLFFDATAEVDLNDSDFQEGMAYLQYLAVIDDALLAVIMAPPPETV